MLAQILLTRFCMNRAFYGSICCKNALKFLACSTSQRILIEQFNSHSLHHWCRTKQKMKKIQLMIFSMEAFKLYYFKIKQG